MTARIKRRLPLFPLSLGLNLRQSLLASHRQLRQSQRRLRQFLVQQDLALLVTK